MVLRALHCVGHERMMPDVLDLGTAHCRLWIGLARCRPAHNDRDPSYPRSRGTVANTCEFELLPARVELEIVRVIDAREATHIRYRIVS